MSDENTNYAIKVSNLHKSFRLPTERSSGIKQVIVNFSRGVKGYEEQKVLRGLSFEVQKGDFFGIVGRNGSGKSTLLKVLAGIYEPEKGAVRTSGSIVPFIELGVGFNPELNGRENIYLNGALLGFSPDEITSMYDDIVDFAELRDFMEQKLKNYSSGMMVRLAFAVAIKARGDILILDEVLAVGDEAFQRKCNDYFSQIKKDKTKTVILVTHSMENVTKYCNKAMMIRDGEIVAFGSPKDVANEYSLENLHATGVANQNGKANEIIKDFKVELLSSKQISQDDEIRIRVSYKTTEDIETYTVCELQDIDRNVPLVTSGCKPTKNRLVSKNWSGKLSAINDTNIMANFVVRNKDNDVIYFLPQHLAPKFIFRRSDYPDPKRRTTYAALFDKGKWQ